MLRKDYGEFLGKVALHSGSVLSGGVLALFSGIWSLISALRFGVTAPITAVLCIVTVLLLLHSRFLAWRDERNRRLEAVQALAKHEAIDPERPDRCIGGATPLLCG